jgi:Mrp family chromosome partitioning ATPase
VILVIEAKRTSHEQARRTCEILQGVGARILGTVLTKAEAESKGAAYYYDTAPEELIRPSTSRESSSRPGKIG